MTTRGELHHLIDELPDTQLDTVRRLLEAVLNQVPDPVLWALVSAPEDDEPETEEEGAAVQRANDDIAQGRVITDEQLAKDLDL